VVFHFAAARVSPIEQVGKWNGSKMVSTAKMGNTLPNDSHQRVAEFHELAAHAHRAAAAHRGKKITRPDTSIPNRQWNMPIRPLSGRKKLIGNPRSQWGSHKGRAAPPQKWSDL
jgi:hypothetical protein